MPAIVGGRREIGLGDVEAADHRAAPVGDDDLLVIADQVAHRALGRKSAETGAGLDQVGKERLVGIRRAEAVDDEADLDAAPGGGGERIADAYADSIVLEDVEGQVERGASLFDQREQRREPVLSCGKDPEFVVADACAERHRIAEEVDLVRRARVVDRGVIVGHPPAIVAARRLARPVRSLR